MYRPRKVTEPVTGLSWLARTPAQARLRWVPLFTIITTGFAMFMAGRLWERLS